MQQDDPFQSFHFHAITTFNPPFKHYTTLFLHLPRCCKWTFALHTLHPSQALLPFINFCTPKITMIVFSCHLHKTKSTLWKYLRAWKLTWPHWKFQTMQWCSKSSRRTWSTPPHPLLTKSKRKQDRLSTQRKVSFASLTFVATKARMHLQHSIPHPRQTSSLMIGTTKKSSF
jgi:hypothetical protein